MSTSTLLEYSISTDPSTVTVNDTDVTLTVMATNNTLGPVAISYIVVQFPVGDDAGDLTVDVSSMSCTGPDDTWTVGSITPIPDSNQYYCQFSAPSGYTLQQLQSVSFSLGGIAIIGDPSSNIVITIAENSPSSTETLDIQIYPAGWAQLSFTASETNIDPGSSVVLFWSGGPVDAEYTLSYMYNNAPVVEPATGTYTSVGSYTTPILSVSTTFTLNVTMGQLCFQAFVPVSVALQVPAINSFTGLVTGTFPNLTLELIWTTSNAINVSANWTNVVFDANPMQPSILNPPFQSSYQISASSYNGQSVQSTVQIGWGVETVIDVTDVDGDYPTYTAITPNGECALVISYSSNSVIVISCDSLTATSNILATLNLGCEIAITPDGVYALITDLSSSIKVIELANPSDITVITMPAQVVTGGVTISDKGDYAFITCNGGDQYWVYPVSLPDFSIGTPIEVAVNCMVVTPSGDRLLCVSGNNIITCISIPNFVVSTSTLGNSLRSIAVSPNGDYAFVTDSSNSVFIMQLDDLSVTQKIELGAQEFGVNLQEVVVTPDGSQALVYNGNPSTISVLTYNGNEFILSQTIDFFPNAGNIAFTPKSNYAFVSNCGLNNVSVLARTVVT